MHDLKCNNIFLPVHNPLQPPSIPTPKSGGRDPPNPLVLTPLKADRYRDRGREVERSEKRQRTENGHTMRKGN